MNAVMTILAAAGFYVGPSMEFFLYHDLKACLVDVDKQKERARWRGLTNPIVICKEGSQ